MSYKEFFKNISPNAKVFLLMSFITALSTGAFSMLFGIVVLQLGRSESFLGQILAIGLLATGVLSLPVASLQIVAFGIFLRLSEKKVIPGSPIRTSVKLQKYSKLLLRSKLIKDVFIYNTLIGFGAGLVIPFFNIFLTHRLKAPTYMVGIVLSTSQVGMAIAGLLAPYLVLKLGKVKSVVASQLVSIPFLLMIALPQSLGIVIVSFLLRSAFMNMSNPISSCFTMEITPTEQRASVASLVGMAQNLSRAASAILGGWLMEKTNYSVPYFITAILYLFASIFYWKVFTPREKELCYEKRIG